jgi:acyl-CoA thioesterase FadM
MKEIPQVRVRIEYEVLAERSVELLAKGYTVHSFIKATTGTPSRPPKEFLDLVHTAFQKG